MNILLLGSGGREHAMAWKISQSKLCKNLFIAPGNAGTKECGENININPNDFDAVSGFAIKENIDLLVIGPEEPLVRGIYDHFTNIPNLKHIKICGPSKAGAMLEGSKSLAKNFMKRYGIPTAAFATFEHHQKADLEHYLKKQKFPLVIKADGLAAGKGVVITENISSALEVVHHFFDSSTLGDAGKKIVVEEFLTGIEVSVFIATDGLSYKILPEAKDYKRIGEGDTGPNTGGMGAVSPVPFADDAFMKKVNERIIQPTLKGIKNEKIIYHGFIFIGLIKVDGDPYVIEYNCRLGDPETEAILPRITSDFAELCMAIASGELNKYELKISGQAAVTIMLVSGGYPASYEKGKEITGLNEVKGVNIFHAGTIAGNNAVFTAGGRVLAVTSMSSTMEVAASECYSEISKINFDKMYFRKDITKDLAEQEIQRER